ncbi:MAG: glycosyltransferase family 4 protein [Candidatus Kerfeldbacteria bacterium]|nr:glycosyltransferase family 4 protein [Candidatus Kerfeldbacteria bacterium]
MKIGFDISAQSLPRSGVGQYQHQLIRHLLKIDSKNEYLLYGFNVRNRKRLEAVRFDAPNCETRVIPIPQRLITLSWMAFRAPALDRIVKGCDVYQVSEISIPPIRKAKRVAFVHDLTTLLFPQFHVPTNVFVHRQRFERLHEVDAILTNSETTKKDVIEHLGIRPEMIHVTPLGADGSFQPLADALVTPVLNRLGLRKPYLLFVGTLEPRKNVETLILAFNALKEKDGIPHQLVLAGQKGWLCEPILRAIETSPYRSDIVQTNYLEEGDLPALMNGAEAFVYPSFYEGFGLPVLEAMQCGTPVVTSTVSSLPEVGGDACLYADPHSFEDLAVRIRMVLQSADLRKIMTEKGIARSRQFSWEQCARKTLAVYESLK